jgi:hypothetical protein
MTMLPQLLMNDIPIRLRPLPDRSGLHGLVSKQLAFQFFLAQALRQRPTDPGCTEIRDIAGRRGYVVV